jgi:hypothetical protein
MQILVASPLFKSTAQTVCLYAIPKLETKPIMWRGAQTVQLQALMKFRVVAVEVLSRGMEDGIFAGKHG